MENKTIQNALFAAANQLPLSKAILNKILVECADEIADHIKFYEKTLASQQDNIYAETLVKLSQNEASCKKILEGALTEINPSTLNAAVYRILPFPVVLKQKYLTNEQIRELCEVKITSTNISEATRNVLSYHKMFFAPFDLMNDEFILSHFDYDILLYTKDYHNYVRTDFIVDNYSKLELSWRLVSTYNLPAEFIKRNLAYLNVNDWANISIYHDIDIPFAEEFNIYLGWNCIGLVNVDNLFEYKNILLTQFQKISTSFLFKYFDKINKTAAFCTLYLNSLNEGFDFEKELENHLDSFFSQNSNELGRFLKNCDFSLSFLKKHYRDFTKHKLKKEIDELIKTKEAIEK